MSNYIHIYIRPRLIFSHAKFPLQPRPRTSNCLMPPMGKYRERIWTCDVDSTGVWGWEIMRKIRVAVCIMAMVLDGFWHVLMVTDWLLIITRRD